MKTLTMVVLGLLIISIGILFADDIDVKLSGTGTANGFSVFDNASTPVNIFRVRSDGKIGIGTASPNYKLDVRGNIGIPASGYLNFSTTEGTSGYGFRDNNGILEYKNSGGTWTPWSSIPTSPYGFPSSAYSYGQISYNHGDYATTQPTVTLGTIGTAYYPMMPCTLGAGGGTPYIVTANGNVEVAYIGGLPAYLKITAPGTYQISASVAIMGNNSAQTEVEVFRQNSASVPGLTSWITQPNAGYHDIESMSSVFEVTNNKYIAGSVTGILDCAANDYITFNARILGGNSQSHRVICINLTAERIK